jgi:hypothetical protein
LLKQVLEYGPDIIGFSIYCWNVDRSLYLAGMIKERISVKAIAGGPEVTPDNERVKSQVFDSFVHGEGEEALRRILRGERDWSQISLPEGSIFRKSSSPYLMGLLEPEIEDIVLTETQRGCPYRCAYCYYNASHRRSVVPDINVTLDCLRWTRERGFSELYLLDPSLDAHPFISPLLRGLAEINSDGAVSLSSEIRAEAVTDEMADLFAASGFKIFEIGLQSANQKALSMMKRRTDLKRFLEGIRRLRSRDIGTRIDIMVGLPGDDPDHFKITVDFLVENGIHEDIQVFPLSLLPGTEFRARHRELGLRFSSDPPYLIDAAPGFSQEDMAEAISYAERKCNVSLNPLPLLDIPYKRSDSALSDCQGTFADFNEGSFITRVIISDRRSIASLEDIARRLTHPYQVTFCRNAFDTEYVGKVLAVFSSVNPFTPFEVVFHEPSFKLDTESLLGSIRLHRPHYLDGDLRFMYPKQGNRAVMFTLLTGTRERIFSGVMKRQVFWWRFGEMPGKNELETFMNLDGVLMDTGDELKRQAEVWQDEFAPVSDDLPAVSFSDELLQRRWLELTASEEMCRGNLFGCSWKGTSPSRR